jgi:hypothetical protein
MKKLLVILVVSFLGLVARSQDDDAGKGEKIRDRMSAYIQQKLGMTKDEADKFTPIFIKYFREFRQIRQDNKGDLLVFKQKIIELRIRYRTEFRNIMEEQKANRVYAAEDEFRQKVIAMTERQKERVEQATQRKNLHQ